MEDLKRHIGWVSQEPVLFHGTIRENLLFGLDDGTSTDDVFGSSAGVDDHVVDSDDDGDNNIQEELPFMPNLNVIILKRYKVSSLILSL